VCSLTPTLTSYLVINPTDEQILAIYEADEENRVWFDEAHQVRGNSSMLEVTFRSRRFEESRIVDFLESMDLEYIKVR